MKLNKIQSLDWINEQSHLFLNPKLPQLHVENMFKVVCSLNQKNHIYLATSGSSCVTDQYKLVGLSKDAFLNSSRAVNTLFSINSEDVLLNLLPVFHVGGLSLFSRAFCAGAKLVNVWNENFKWNPSYFINTCQNARATITSLVPTQIFDLINAGYKSPSNLRCVFVGGGSLSSDLLLRAQALDWKLYPTYGMTECCSQVATFTPSEQAFKILPHLNVSIDENSCINISGTSLLTHYIHIDGTQHTISDPTINRIFTTQDIGKLSNNRLILLGRKDDNIKINGEFVNLLNVNHTFQKAKDDLNLPLESTIIAIPHERTNSQLVAVFLKKDSKNSSIQTLQTNYNSQVMTYERIHHITFVDSIPKTDLGKIKVNLLKQNIELEQMN